MLRYYYIYISIGLYKNLEQINVYYKRAGYTGRSRMSLILGLFVSLNLFAKRQ